MSDIYQNIETFNTVSDSILYDIIEKYFTTSDLLKLRMTNKNYYNKTNDNNLFKLMFLNLRENNYLINERSKKSCHDCNFNCFYKWCKYFYNIYVLKTYQKYPNIFSREYINIQINLLNNIKQDNLNNNICTIYNGLPPPLYYYHQTFPYKKQLLNIWKQLKCPCVNKMHYEISTLYIGNNQNIINSNYKCS